MKNLLMIAIALITINATAQEPQRDAKKGARSERMRVAKDFNPEEMAKIKTKKMVLALDLTEAQQSEVEKVFVEEAKTRKAKMEAYQTEKANSVSKNLSTEDRNKMINERLDDQIAMKKKMMTILNSQQLEKWEKMNEEHKRMRRHHRRSGSIKTHNER